MNEITVISQDLRSLYKSTVKESLVKTLALTKAPKLRSYSPNISDQCWVPVANCLDAFVLMCGVKDPVSDQEMSAIIKIVKREFPDFTLAEIDEAFSLYNARKLDFKTDHFNKFSASFIGSILQSYRQYRRTNLSELNKYKKESTDLFYD